MVFVFLWGLLRSSFDRKGAASVRVRESDGWPRTPHAVWSSRKVEVWGGVRKLGMIDDERMEKLTRHDLLLSDAASRFGQRLSGSFPHVEFRSMFDACPHGRTPTCHSG